MGKDAIQLTVNTEQGIRIVTFININKETDEAYAHINQYDLNMSKDWECKKPKHYKPTIVNVLDDNDVIVNKIDEIVSRRLSEDWKYFETELQKIGLTLVKVEDKKYNEEKDWFDNEEKIRREKNDNKQ